MKFSLDGPTEQILITDKDIGKVLEFGSRAYLVKEIDVDKKSLLIEKRASPQGSSRTETLTLP